MYTPTPLQRLHLKKQKQSLKLNRSLKKINSYEAMIKASKMRNNLKVNEKNVNIKNNNIKKTNSTLISKSSFINIVIGATVIASIMDD